jgi:hypothetical protein
MPFHQGLLCHLHLAEEAGGTPFLGKTQTACALISKTEIVTQFRGLGLLGCSFMRIRAWQTGMQRAFSLFGGVRLNFWPQQATPEEANKHTRERGSSTQISAFVALCCLNMNAVRLRFRRKKQMGLKETKKES